MKWRSRIIFAQELLAAGVPADEPGAEDGYRPLHWACCYGRTDCVASLLQASRPATRRVARRLGAKLARGSTRTLPSLECSPPRAGGRDARRPHVGRDDPDRPRGWEGGPPPQQ